MNSMREADLLAERHIQEWESKLRHIDELMCRARTEASARAVPPETAAELSRIHITRNRVSVDLHGVRAIPHTDLPRLQRRGGQVVGVLESLGRQLEALLEALFKYDKHEGPREPKQPHERTQRPGPAHAPRP